MMKFWPVYLFTFLISYGTLCSLAVVVTTGWDTGSVLKSLNQDNTYPISDPLGQMPIEEKTGEEFQLSLHELSNHDLLICSPCSKLPFASLAFAPHQVDYPVTVPPPDFG